MTEIIITLVIIAAAMVFFVWNVVPAAVVAVCASLLLFFTGVLTMQETLAGLGDPVVILIAALLGIGAGLEVAGVGAWAGQLLIRYTGASETWRIVAIMTVAAILSGLIGMNGAVAAMLPIVVTVAVRTGVASSRLMIPLAFGCLTGSKLTLLGTPVNLIASTQADELGVGHIGFFEWAVLGIPLLAGTIAIVLLFGKRLLPERRSRSIPVDFSAHAQTLVEQYNLEDAPDTLLNRSSGLAEVVIPSRSSLIGESMFPGMATEDGRLMILAIQRGGIEMPPEPVALRAGDHLLLQGTWNALDQYLSDPKVLAVDSPEAVQKQAVALGHGAPAAIAILVLLVILLAFNLVPAPVAAVLCATLMVITRVLTLPQLYRGIDWNICILIGAMIPPATAMTKTGAAALIGDYVVGALGSFGPHVVLAGIFVVSAVITQFISNTSSALVMMPIGVATASELGVNPLPMMMGVAMGASASFLTPFANGVSAMVYGPGAYRFGDFWRIGAIVTIWALIVTVAIVPLFWKF